MSVWRMKSNVNNYSVASHWSIGYVKPRVVSLALRVLSNPHPFLSSHFPPRLMSNTTHSSPFNRLSSIRQHFSMNAQELKNFLADSPPSTVNLVIKKHFDALDDQQKRYAHYISKYEEPISSPVDICPVWIS